MSKLAALTFLLTVAACGSSSASRTASSGRTDRVSPAEAAMSLFCSMSMTGGLVVPARVLALPHPEPEELLEKFGITAKVEFHQAKIVAESCIVDSISGTDFERYFGEDPSCDVPSDASEGCLRETPSGWKCIDCRYGGSIGVIISIEVAVISPKQAVVLINAVRGQNSGRQIGLLMEWDGQVWRVGASRVLKVG